MNTTEAHDDPYPFEDFAPTLSQCFVIVTVGYLMARSELLRSSDVRGLNAFAAYFAMPGIICTSLMEADFGDFRWQLLVGIFVAKSVLFVAVAGLLLLLREGTGVAGTVALFVVQSNDLPVGNPLMSSLYKDHRPQMMKYLFLVPALTVLLFVPTTNCMINIHRKRLRTLDATERGRIPLKEHLKHFGPLLKNPVLIATASGIALNFVFGGNPPPVLHQPIKVAAATIPGIALALLGCSFVRKERHLISSAVVPAMVLLVLKMVVTPVLSHTVLRILTVESESTKLLSDFALLYGILSPAVAVFQSGKEFRKPLAAMSVALILSSLLCFPVSYVVARFTIAPAPQLNTYVPASKRALLWTACASILADVAVWTRMIRKRRRILFPGSYVMYLVLTQCLTCCGVVVWSLTGREAWSPYCQTVLYYGGEVSGYLWTCTLAAVLVLGKGLSVLAYASVGVPVLLSAVMCFLTKYNKALSVLVVGRASSKFEFLQLTIATVVLFVSLTVVAGCAICHFKRRKIKAVADTRCYDNAIFTLGERQEGLNFCKKIDMPKVSAEKLSESEEANLYYEEVVRGFCGETGQSSAEREWTNRLRSLVLLQSSVMSVRLIANLFKLGGSKSLEIMIPLEFLQSVLFVGQGVFFLFLFGIDVRTLTIAARKWWRNVRAGADEIPPNVADDEEVSRVCRQFCKFYFKRCFRDLARERRWRGLVYRDSFWGHQLVEWALSEGLCGEDAEAEGLGQKLLAGGAIGHVTRRHHFYDAPYLYYFADHKRPDL